MQPGFKLLVDSREKPKTRILYDLIDAEFEVEALQTDIVLRDEREKPFRNIVGIEKKHWMDLYGSIITHKEHGMPRFLDQVERLVAYHEHPMVIIFGDLKEAEKKVHDAAHININENLIWGTLASIAIRAGVEVNTFPTELDAVKFAYLYCTKMSEGKFREKRSRLPKYKKFHPIQVLVCVPGITKEAAKRLIEKYGTLRMIGRTARVNPEELKTIKGIGEHQIENLNTLFNKEW